MTPHAPVVTVPQVWRSEQGWPQTEPRLRDPSRGSVRGARPGRGPCSVHAAGRGRGDTRHAQHLHACPRQAEGWGLQPSGQPPCSVGLQSWGEDRAGAALGL